MFLVLECKPLFSKRWTVIRPFAPQGVRSRLNVVQNTYVNSFRLIRERWSSKRQKQRPTAASNSKEEAWEEEEEEGARGQEAPNQEESQSPGGRASFQPSSGEVPDKESQEQQVPSSQEGTFLSENAGSSVSTTTDSQGSSDSSSSGTVTAEEGQNCEGEGGAEKSSTYTLSRGPVKPTLDFDVLCQEEQQHMPPPVVVQYQEDSFGVRSVLNSVVAQAAREVEDGGAAEADEERNDNSPMDLDSILERSLAEVGIPVCSSTTTAAAAAEECAGRGGIEEDLFAQGEGILEDAFKCFTSVMAEETKD